MKRIPLLLKQNTVPRKEERCSYGKNSVLLRNDRFARANACAGAAVDALVGIDNVDVAGRNGLDGAFADAGAVGNARNSDLVSYSLEFFVFS